MYQTRARQGMSFATLASAVRQWRMRRLVDKLYTMSLLSRHLMLSIECVVTNYAGLLDDGTSRGCSSEMIQTNWLEGGGLASAVFRLTSACDTGIP